MMKNASIALSESQWASSDIRQEQLHHIYNSRKIIDNVSEASEVVEVHVDNVAGVKLPVFKSRHRDVVSGTLCIFS